MHDVFGTQISTVSAAELGELLARRDQSRAIVINCCNVHSVISARHDPVLSEALRAGDINTPDGMPLVWVLRSGGHPAQRRITGMDIAHLAFTRGIEAGWRHYFYGSTPQTLAALERNLVARFPRIRIAGTYSPPFRELTSDERRDIGARIRDAKPDIVWVGLGMPKQEKWMHAMRDELPGTVLVGIGAAFDFLGGTQKHAPVWMQDAGLEWLYRLAREPRRLWRRYAVSNPAFLALWLRHRIKKS